MNIGSRKKWSLFFIMIGVMLTVSACGGSTKDAKPAETKKKVVNIGMMNAPSGFNPLESSDTAQNVSTAILFLPLLELNDDMTYAPQLADSVETKDNQTYTIKLNPKAKWTDGKPITVDDVIFTLNLISNPKVASTVASNFNILDGLNENGKRASDTAPISGVKKIDDHTLTIKTKVPVDQNLFNDCISRRLKTMPAHVLKDVDVTKLYQHPFMQKPDVTSGALKLVTFQKGQYVQFAANKEYFRGAPKIDEVYFKLMPGANITAQLQSGEIDMNDPTIGLIPFEDYEKVKSMPNVTSESGGVPTTIQRIMINVKTITDPKVRKAISTAINRKMIIDNLLKGEGEAIELPYWSGSPFLNKNVPQSSYDPEKAKQLLKEAGWDPGRVVNFSVPTGNKVREQVADIIAENLKAIGMNVQIQKYDFVTSMSKAKKGEYDIYIVGISANPTVPDISTVLQTGASLNLAHYSNQEMDDLLVAGKNEVDPVKAKQIYDKVQEIFAQDMPSPCVYIQNQLRATSKRMLVGKPKLFGAFINVQDWDIKN
jgi:peptide/nickel transport system substrate-binding protein